MVVKAGSHLSIPDFDLDLPVLVKDQSLLFVTNNWVCDHAVLVWPKENKVGRLISPHSYHLMILLSEVLGARFEAGHIGPAVEDVNVLVGCNTNLLVRH